MRAAVPALALFLAAAQPLRAEEPGTRGSATHTAVRGVGDPALESLGLIFDTVAFGMQVAALESAASAPVEQGFAQRRDDDAYYRPARRPTPTACRRAPTSPSRREKRAPCRHAGSTPRTALHR